MQLDDDACDPRFAMRSQKLANWWGGGEGRGNTYRFDVRLGQIFVQFPEMDESEGDADHVDGDPKDV